MRGEGQGGNGEPGTSHIYMRGVVSGGTATTPARSPASASISMKQPVTTIDGTVDVHLYDIQRIEVLEGPQGTLYGASSEAGTVRIISNKPDPTKFEAGYDAHQPTRSITAASAMKCDRHGQSTDIPDLGRATGRLGRA